MEHVLKTWPEFFEQVWNEEKLFEIRLNDRDYTAGDTVLLQEYDGKNYSGRAVWGSIAYVLEDPRFCRPSYVILSIPQIFRTIVEEWAEPRQRKPQEPDIKTLRRAMEIMAECITFHADCPAASVGSGIWPECEGESESCGDEKTVAECWMKYCIERARKENFLETLVHAKSIIIPRIDCSEIRNFCPSCSALMDGKDNNHA